MTRKHKILFALALTLPEVGLIGVAVFKGKRFTTILPTDSATFAGSVLVQNSDPSKQTPLAGVTVKAYAGDRTVETKSDPSGYFSLTLKPSRKGASVLLGFESAGYKPLEISASLPVNQLYIARMQPLEPRRTANPASIVEIKNIQVRYSYKNESTMGVGSLAKQFTAPNTGNVPCKGQDPCSPDGRWKATKSTLSIAAEEGSEFGNIRVSCIAGPCAFTKTEPDHFGPAERKINVTVLNWSDTADFLVEADISKTMVTEAVRISYPFVLGETMNFALPPSSEGPSVEAEIGGQYVVFPLGPDLIVSWGSCSLEVSPNGDKMYRCQAKPGFRLAG